MSARASSHNRHDCSTLLDLMLSPQPRFPSSPARRFPSFRITPPAPSDQTRPPLEPSVTVPATNATRNSGLARLFVPVRPMSYSRVRKLAFAFGEAACCRLPPPGRRAAAGLRQQPRGNRTLYRPRRSAWYNHGGRMPMWTDEQRQRYHTLCEREQSNMLTAEEAAELAVLGQQFCDAEAVYLAPANERKAQEIAEVTAAVERLEAENRQ